MSAAIIHIVNISSHPGAIDLETEMYLAEAIRMMHEMMQDTIIIGRYLVIMRDLIPKWCKEIPARVREAMEEVNIGNIGTPQSTAGASNSPPHATSINGAATNGNTNGNYIDAMMGENRPPASEFLPITPRIDVNGWANGSKTPQQQNLFWTPYPESFEGVPLALPHESSHLNHNMDITNVLDSGITGDWPQWNKDGFTMGGDDGNAQIWGINWDAPA